MSETKGERKIEIPRGIPKDWASRLEAFYKVSSKDKSVSSAPLGSDCGGEQPTFEEEMVKRVKDMCPDAVDDYHKFVAKEISKLAEKTALEAVGEEIEDERSLYSNKEFELLKKLTSPATAETIAVNYKVGINSARYQAHQRIKELFGGGEGKNG